MLRFFDATAGTRPVLAVVEVDPNVWHGFGCDLGARIAVRSTKAPGFWRLKERKA